MPSETELRITRYQNQNHFAWTTQTERTFTKGNINWQNSPSYIHAMCIMYSRWYHVRIMVSCRYVFNSELTSDISKTPFPVGVNGKKNTGICLNVYYIQHYERLSFYKCSRTLEITSVGLCGLTTVLHTENSFILQYRYNSFASFQTKCMDFLVQLDQYK